MTPTCLLVAGTDAADVGRVVEVLGTAPGLRARPGLSLQALHTTVDSQLRARDGLERGPHGALPGWVEAAVADFLASVPAAVGQGVAVVPALDLPDPVLRRLAVRTAGLAVVDDPRRGFQVQSADPLHDAVVWGRRWAQRVESMVAAVQRSPRWMLASLVDPTVAARVSAFLAQLGVRLPRPVVSARPPLQWDPLLEAALRVDPRVDPLLQQLGLRRPPVAPPSAHSTLARAHAEAALQRGDVDTARAVLEHASADGAADALRAACARRLGDAFGAASLLSEHLDHGRGPDAVRVEALALGAERVAVEVARAVVASDPEPVRVALARWLVARGLDAEAAEVVAAVEGTGWRTGVRTVA